MAWPTKKLGEVLEYEQPTKYLVNSTNYKDEYSTSVLTAGKSFILGKTNEKNGIFPKEKLPVIIFDDFTTAIKFVDFPFKVKSSAMKILHRKKGKADIRFLFLKMQTIKFIPKQHKRYWISEYSNIEIVIPPLKIQKQIVERLDKIAEAQKLNDELIQKTDELFKSLLHQELNPAGKDWEVKKLGDIAEIIGGFAFKSKDLIDKKLTEEYLPVIKIGNVLKSGDINILNVQYHKFDNSLEKYLINSGDILVAMTGATVGKVVSSYTTNLLLNQRVGLIRSRLGLADQSFLGIVLETKMFYEYCQKTAGGGAQGNISPTQIMLYETILPPPKIQKKIVEKLSAVQEYKKQLLEQKSKLKELFDSVLSKSMKN